MESSRSGASKRVCDKCVAGVPAGGAGAGGDSDDDDAAMARGAGKLGVSDDKGKGAGAASASSGGEAARRPAPGMPLIKIEDAVRALSEHPFKGCWEAMLTFHVVELGKGGGSGGDLKPGSRLHILMDLETKGAAYFKGAVADFGCFGKEGKITGALQRAAGASLAAAAVAGNAAHVMVLPLM
jgi:hypothetical protein